jgi:ComF family protein
MPWDSFQFHGPYEGLLGELVRDYKFNGRLGLGRLLSSLLEDLLSHSGLTGAELLAPVPLHPRRLAQRGFNQSLELARPLAAKLGARLAPGALTRIRHTVPQTRLTGRRRRANLKGAFEADRELVAGRKVLLLDDIMTTGGTLMECARTLKRARAEEVAVLVLARTGREP